MCCVSNVGLPLVAGLAVAIGAFGFVSAQPEPTPAAEKPAGGCCQGAAVGSEGCCGGCSTDGGECAGEAEKQPAEDPQPEAGSAHVGELAPDFALIDLEGNRHQLSEYTEAGKIVVLEWFNPECPFVVKHHERFTTMADTFAALTEVESDDEEPGVVWLAINSAREGHATGDHDFNAEAVEKWEIAYPVLMDPTGIVGRAYEAKTTPHMYVIAADGTLIYAGAIDNNPSPREAGDVNYVLQAIQQHMAGETVTDAETRPYGCGVKY